MESEPTKNPSRTQTKGIPCFFCSTFFIFFTIFFLLNPKPLQNPTTKTLLINPTVKPSLSLSSLSPDSTHHLLQLSINRTITLVSISHPKIITFFHNKTLDSQETIALEDCLDMLDQTLYELTQAVDLLLASPSKFSPRFYANLKTLLSAAMTNEQTCIDGFLDLAKTRPGKEVFGSYLEKKLTPVIRTIAKSLARIKHLEEGMNRDSWGSRNRFPPWMRVKDRRMMMGMRGVGFGMRNPNVVVARDGSGDFWTVSEAVKRAPNMSVVRYVIKIKAGVYRENVEIPRNKVNIMLVGEGMNCTVITASRSLADGFSTFNSATLTVVGDRFIARDLTIENMATPEKHQAVALRVTANAAFYRCNLTAHQDTLYAHSLVQLFQECTIQGTIDFIFGNALAVFHNCLILARKPIPGQSNMITAQSRDDPNQNTGFLIHNCTVRASPEFTLWDQRRSYTFLGRPWRNYSRTVVMGSYLGKLIHPRGWAPWDQYSNLDTVENVEYMNFGPGSSTKYRVRWGGYKKNYTDDVDRRFTMGAFWRVTDYWFKTTGFPVLVRAQKTRSEM